MSELLEKQQHFTYMISLLIKYAYDELGWKLTFGDAYRDERCPYGTAKSLHRKRLAVDFNLFVDGEWIDGAGTADQQKREFMLWERLGIYWEKLGGSWGGRFQTGKYAKDLNHFSFSFGGMR